MITCISSGGITKSLPVTVKVTLAPAVSNPPQPFGNVAGPWKLMFDSEFNGSSLDTYQWSTGVDGAPGITNGYDAAIEQECYDPAQVNISGGTLNLTAITKTEYCPPYGGTELYTSGSITTYGHFSYTYGYAEARIWLPGTNSIIDWPAFWELGKLYDVSAGEIDILESLEGEACATFHNSIASPSYCSTGSYAGGWHTFAADWEPGYINFYFDGTNVLSVNSGITSSPMYLVLDLALSSKITSPDTTPATMKIDYVRVWQHS
jgi:beta-glucanase (GH16 family)